MKEKILIALGGTAGRLCLQSGLEPVLYIDLDEVALQKYPPDYSLYLETGVTACQGAGGALAPAKKLFRQNREKIIRFCSMADDVLLVAAIGGGTGSSAAVLASLLLDQGKQVSLLLLDLSLENHSGLSYNKKQALDSARNLENRLNAFQLAGSEHLEQADNLSLDDFMALVDSEFVSFIKKMY